MQAIIKEMRNYLQMSQAELAERLDVNFTTVNGWENGQGAPNRVTQEKLYEICREREIPVYEMTLQKIADMADKIEIPSERMLLYHGSKSGIQGAIAPKSRKQCDFGCGFYMGTEPEQALTLICDYDKSKLYIVSIDCTELECLEVSPDIDWAMLVAYHRGRMERIKGTALYEKYRDMGKKKDLMIGNIANDRMFYVIDNFFIGNITDKALVKSLSALQLGKQYVAVTQKCCDVVRVEVEISLSHLERRFMKDVAEENRIKGSSLAKEICKSYRREGLFFDEILDGTRNGE